MCLFSVCFYLFFCLIYEFLFSQFVVFSVFFFNSIYISSFFFFFSFGNALVPFFKNCPVWKVISLIRLGKHVLFLTADSIFFFFFGFWSCRRIYNLFTFLESSFIHCGALKFFLFITVILEFFVLITVPLENSFTHYGAFRKLFIHHSAFRKHFPSLQSIIKATLFITGLLEITFLHCDAFWKLFYSSQCF